MWVRMIMLSVIGALIGWITNVLAVKLIFRPIHTIRIPLIGLEIQGLIPKRRKELAKSIGETVEKELISIEEILERVIENQDKKDIINTIKIKINEVIIQKVPSLLPKSIKNLILSYVDEVIDQEVEPAFNQILEKFINTTMTTVKIGEMVEEKINEFDLIKLESIIINITKRELKQIEYLGGVIGFFIGIIQAILISFF